MYDMQMKTFLPLLAVKTKNRFVSKRFSDNEVNQNFTVVNRRKNEAQLSIHCAFFAGQYELTSRSQVELP